MRFGFRRYRFRMAQLHSDRGPHASRVDLRGSGERSGQLAVPTATSAERYPRRQLKPGTTVAIVLLLAIGLLAIWRLLPNGVPPKVSLASPVNRATLAGRHSLRVSITDRVT